MPSALAQNFYTIAFLSHLTQEGKSRVIYKEIAGEDSELQDIHRRAMIGEFIICNCTELWQIIKTGSCGMLERIDNPYPCSCNAGSCLVNP